MADVGVVCLTAILDFPRVSIVFNMTVVIVADFVFQNKKVLSQIFEKMAEDSFLNDQSFRLIVSEFHQLGVVFVKNRNILSDS